MTIKCSWLLSDKRNDREYIAHCKLNGSNYCPEYATCKIKFNAEIVQTITRAKNVQINAVFYPTGNEINLSFKGIEIYTQKVFLIKGLQIAGHCSL